MMDATRYKRVARDKEARLASLAKAQREEDQRRERHAKLRRRLARSANRQKAWADWLTQDCDD